MFKIHYWNAGPFPEQRLVIEPTEPCFLSQSLNHMSHKEMHCLRNYFICHFPDSGYFCTTWLLRQVKQISVNKENFYWPNWVYVETFLKWKANAIYDRKTLAKKAKSWVEILTYLTRGGGDRGRELGRLGGGRGKGGKRERNAKC